MTLTKYGTDNILVMLLAGVIAILAGVFLKLPIISPLLEFLGIILIVFTFVFFRDPKRELPEVAKENNSIVISPADGLVREIVEVDNYDYVDQKCKQISIFLSPLDVHVNRIPVGGTIEKVEYQEGKFLAAYKFEASTQNEMSIIYLNNPNGKVIFKQIVGVLARRIVYNIKKGDKVKTGDKFGMMKFGSRMDIIIPEKSNVKVEEGMRVKGGVTVIAEL